mgnify:CR=1 FL=1
MNSMKPACIGLVQQSANAVLNQLVLNFKIVMDADHKKYFKYKKILISVS